MNWPRLAEVSDPFLAWLWRTSCQASLVIVVVLVAQWLLRNHLAPRWRHALWLLVLLRLALPGSVESPFSLFNWARLPSPAPAVESSNAPIVPESDSPAEEWVEAGATQPTQPAPPAPAPRSGWSRWGLIWLAGALSLPAYLAVSTWRLGRGIRRQRPLTDSTVLNLLEDCKQEMGVHTPLVLIETPAVASPALFGWIRPRLLLPVGLTRSFSPAELRYVFLHELSHLKRGDIPWNWLAAVPLALHWFNPLIWFAFRRMRADGELACDALALSHTGETERHRYGHTIIRLLESFSSPAIAPSLAGLSENHNQMQQRIRMIAKFRKTHRWPILVAPVFTVLALLTLTDAQSQSSSGNAASAGGNSDPQAPPRIIATSPKVGDTEVDPAIAEITVTFDRDMAEGFSWTGGGPDFPSSPEGQKARWKDKRTCALPVKLQPARYYRVGINSTSFQNFRSATGVPAKTSAVFFTTQGASAQLKQRVLKPEIVAITPLNGAKDVDPGLKELRVTFSVPMAPGFSWTGGGPEFPTIPEGKKPFWIDGNKVCVLPVELKPGSNYRLGLNSPSHKNFQSAGGVPLEPVVYTFRTKE
jgi:beta-lactamase regulating signal transducer with metallopeptidase domain